MLNANGLSVDQKYHIQRAEDELRLAKASREPQVRRIHVELSKLHNEQAETPRE